MRHGLVLVFVAAALMIAAPLLASAPPSTAPPTAADDSPPEDSQDRPTAQQYQPQSQDPPSVLGNFIKRWVVHGYFTQAYAELLDIESEDPFFSNFIQSNIYGATQDGTVDYHTAALQLQYNSPRGKNAIVLQLEDERLGNDEVTKEVRGFELGWAFYRRRLTDNVHIQFGRLPQPRGIYNEIRDVGTLLPFYRAPATFYRESESSADNVDGVGLSYRLRASKPWSYELDAFFGEWELHTAFTSSQGDPRIVTADARGGGVRIWVITPLEGVRFGGGILDAEATGGPELPGGNRLRLDEWILSFDANLIPFTANEFPSFLVQAEYREKGPVGPRYVGEFGGNLVSLEKSWYVLAGIQFNRKFAIYGQQDRLDELGGTLPSPPGIPPAVISVPRTHRHPRLSDIGLSLSYRLLQNFVLRAEYHETTSWYPKFIHIVPTPNGLVAQHEHGNGKRPYAILSASFSF